MNKMAKLIFGVVALSGSWAQAIMIDVEAITVVSRAGDELGFYAFGGEFAWMQVAHENPLFPDSSNTWSVSGTIADTVMPFTFATGSWFWENRPEFASWSGQTTLSGAGHDQF